MLKLGVCILRKAPISLLFLFLCCRQWFDSMRFDKRSSSVTRRPTWGGYCREAAAPTHGSGCCGSRTTRSLTCRIDQRCGSCWRGPPRRCRLVFLFPRRLTRRRNYPEGRAPDFLEQRFCMSTGVGRVYCTRTLSAALLGRQHFLARVYSRLIRCRRRGLRRQQHWSTFPRAANALATSIWGWRICYMKTMLRSS